MLRSSLLISVAISPFFFSPVSAQDVFDLGEIIVSSGLSPIEADALGRAASVVTAQQIKERGIATVQDALRALPGVSVNGSSNTFTQVRIRGGEANHTLILIDGIEAAGGGRRIYSQWTGDSEHRAYRSAARAAIGLLWC